MYKQSKYTWKIQNFGENAEERAFAQNVLHALSTQSGGGSMTSVNDAKAKLGRSTDPGVKALASLLPDRNTPQRGGGTASVLKDVYKAMQRDRATYKPLAEQALAKLNQQGGAGLIVY